MPNPPGQTAGPRRSLRSKTAAYLVSLDGRKTAMFRDVIPLFPGVDRAPQGEHPVSYLRPALTIARQCNA